MIIGGLGSLWGTLVGGIVLGIAQTLGSQIDPGWGILSGHLVFLAILAVRPRGLFSKQVHVMAAPWLRSNARPAASRVRSRPRSYSSWPPPRYRSGALQRDEDAVTFLTLLALAQMWNLLAGYAGLISVGQQAYIGIGAYSLYVLADVVASQPLHRGVRGGSHRRPDLASHVVLAFRLRGGYFAVGTWVIAEVYRLLVMNNNQVGGGSGVTIKAAGHIRRATREHWIYWLALFVAVASVALVYFFLRSRQGLALTAIRDDETAADSLGINVMRSKRLVYFLAAVGCGLTGAVIYLNLLRIQPEAAFSVQYSALMIFAVVIGGVGTIEGPIIGTAVFFILQQTLSSYGAWYLVLLGAIAMVVTVWAKRGLWGFVVRWWSIQLFPVRRRVRVEDGVSPMEQVAKSASAEAGPAASSGADT